MLVLLARVLGSAQAGDLPVVILFSFFFFFFCVFGEVRSAGSVFLW